MPQVLTRQPENTDLLQVTKFILTIPRINNVQYFLQDATLPGVSLSVITRQTPIVDLWSPGSKMAYNEFNVTFLVDEDLRSWTDIHDWMRGLSGGVTDDEWQVMTKKNNNPTGPFPQYSDGILTIMSGLNNPKIRIKYANMFPTDLSDIKFDSTLSSDHILTATAKFRFDYFDIERLT
jgi:hypothetical protein